MTLKPVFPVLLSLRNQKDIFYDIPCQVFLCLYFSYSELRLVVDVWVTSISLITVFVPLFLQEYLFKFFIMLKKNGKFFFIFRQCNILVKHSADAALTHVDPLYSLDSNEMDTLTENVQLESLVLKVPNNFSLGIYLSKRNSKQIHNGNEVIKMISKMQEVPRGTFKVLLPAKRKPLQK